MSVREYIGARYVPVFADPIQWDPTLVYEPLTVVTDQGASYVSRRYVPEGIQLDNTDYWVLWADFNAQLQHYINEVNTFDGRIDALEDALPIADYTSASTVSDAISALSGKFPIDTADIADDAITADKIDDGAVGTSAIDDDAVTNAKIATGAVDTAEIADDAITAAKIDDDAITTDAIADSAVTLDKMGFNLGDGFSTEKNIFVAGTTGDDANGGTSDSDAVKTIDRAFEIAEKSGKRNIAIRIRENGTYTSLKNEFSNMTLHFTQGQSANNSKIVFDNGLVSAYCCYFHISTYEQYTFELEFNSGIHSDNCAWYIENAQLHVHSRGDFNYSQMWVSKGTIISHVTMNAYLSQFNFSDAVFSSTDIHFWLYTRCCMVRFINTLEINCTQDFTGGWPFRFDESFVAAPGITVSITKKNTSNWMNFVQIQRSICVLPTSIQTSVASAISGNFAGGNTSILKQTSGIDTQ